MSLKEIEKLLLETLVSEEVLAALENDPRSGARQIADAFRARQQRNTQEEQRLENLFRLEKELWQQDFRMIAGVDEAGIGPLAGPVVAAAAILPQEFCRIEGLNDSKKISDPRRREELEIEIKKIALAWSVGQADVDEIDRLNIYHAGLLAMRRAVDGLKIRPDYLLVDARAISDCAIPQRGVIHGDALSASIAAASIIAKTARDRIMLEIDARYPEYGFAAHKGYPTPEHLEALKKFGALPIHRKSFAPVKQYLV